MSLPRQSRMALNSAWRFRLESAGDDWRTISLPHTWNVLDTMETDRRRHYHRGIGVYARRLAAPYLQPGERLWLEVEAAAMKASVELNGRSVGEHLGG